MMDGAGAARWAGLYVKGFSLNLLKSVRSVMHDQPQTCDTLLKPNAGGFEAKLTKLACVG